MGANTLFFISHKLTLGKNNYMIFITPRGSTSSTVVIFSVALPIKIIAPFLDQILTSAPKICLLLFILETTFVPSVSNVRKSSSADSLGPELKISCAP